MMNCFNSILVQLEVPSPGIARAFLFCFNSILVQLEVAVSLVLIIVHSEFQFHIGAIRSFFLRTETNELAAFQFHIGAIRRDLQGLHV